MKRFVNLSQTFSTLAIMEIEEGESLEQVKERIREYCKNNGDDFICCGGDISFEILRDRQPTKEDEISFECID